MIRVTPDPVAFTIPQIGPIGPIPIPWYGLGYAVAVSVALWLGTRHARRRGLDTTVLGDGVFWVFIAGLFGARTYHVIDRWDLYQNDPLKIVLPPYTGLALYGGLVGGLIAMIVFLRRRGQPFWRWADVAAPAVLLAQAIARWGNFFNQELYGPPTNLPWGVAIQCQYRVPEWPCATYPFDTTAFHPLFLYESLLSLVGVGFLLLAMYRFGGWLKAGDLALIYFMWYSGERFLLEFLRAGYNYTFFQVPVAQLFAALFFVGAAVLFARRHRRDWPPKPIPLPPTDQLARLPGGIAEGEPTGDGSGPDVGGDEAEVSPA
jgi:phosphatidylglycerol:prolipoprotein diacylglycerol transferase